MFDNIVNVLYIRLNISYLEKLNFRIKLELIKTK